MSRPRPQCVIWITTDHMRYDGIAAHGNGAMHTPNLDRLVHQGVSFDSCFAQNPLCMPSRASFMTGLYPQQTGVTQNGQCLPPDFWPTAPRTFSAGGYYTAQIGKLHFQPHEEHDLDPRARHDYGFDFFQIAEEAGCYEDSYMTWLRSEHPEYVTTFRVPRSVSPQRSSEVEGKVLDAPWQCSHSGWIAESACRFISPSPDFHRQRQFLHLGFFAPHPPLNPTREMFQPYDGAEIPMDDWPEHEADDKPEPMAGWLRNIAKDWSPERFREYRRHFYAMVTGVDLAVGQLLKHLEATGLLDDTLIVFTSDHGDMCGDHGLILKQGSYYDQLMHMPLVMHWPNGLGTQARRVTGLVEMVDILPTMLDLAQCDVPEVMIGRNYAPALLAGEEIDAREDVFAYHEPNWSMLRTEDHKYIYYGPEAEVLFDLRNDPRELRNIASENPQALAVMRERMMRRALNASRSRLLKTNRF